MKKDADYFGDEELDLIFVAKRLRDATRLEQILTDAAIDFAVETEEYIGGFLFKTKRIGAFFYVRGDVLEQARATLTAHHYNPFRG